LAQAHWITPRSGGNGAVRDLCDLLMLATGAYAGLLQEYGA
jgi:3-deoxy-D-manno-octulosonate 8-phosphate phosphatase (KDO 8-P phosphatase)